LLGSILLEILLPGKVHVGEKVPITLRLTNTARVPVEAYFQGRPVAYDVIISRADSSVVWRRLEGSFVSAVLQVRTLAPGESLEFKETWSQRNNSGKPVPPGEYLVTGVLPTDPPAKLQTAAVPLLIEP
jgi:hypothetical protein